MGRAIDLFVTYRFLKLLTTPFKKTDAFKLGIIDEKGHRITKPNSDVPAVSISTTAQKNAYTILHKLVFNIKKLLTKYQVLEQKLVHMLQHYFYLKTHLKNLLMTQMYLKKNL